jgi:hypothetical protein
MSSDNVMISAEEAVTICFGFRRRSVRISAGTSVIRTDWGVKCCQDSKSVRSECSATPVVTHRLRHETDHSLSLSQHSAR